MVRCAGWKLKKERGHSGPRPVGNELAVVESENRRKSALVNSWRACHHFHGNKPLEVFGISPWVSWGETVLNSQPFWNLYKSIKENVLRQGLVGPVVSQVKNNCSLLHTVHIIIRKGILC